MSSVDKSDEKDANSDGKAENLWMGLLSDVRSGAQTKLTASRTVIVLGDNESGKTTLIAKMRGVDDIRKGSGLEFSFINVKDEYGDDQTRLSVWIVDGDLYYHGMLKFALTEQNFAHSCILLVASLARPWDIMDSLQRWIDVLSTYIQRLKLTPQVRRQREDSILRHFREYVEPVEGATGQPRRTTAVTSPDTDTACAISALGENTLTENLGIPIVVVLTKSDSVTLLEKDNDYRDEHFDFIQQHVRKFCMKFGAALFYTSAKEDKNCSLLYRYIIHRLYGFPFSENASVIEKDCVFFPSGWDTDKKIAILYEGLNNMRHDDGFNDVITRPATRKAVQQREAEVTCEDEQVFLLRLQGLLAKQPTTSPGSTQRTLQFNPARSPVGLKLIQESQNLTTGPAGPKTTVSPRVPVSAVGSTGTPKKPDGTKLNPATSDTGVLANFFNSLLSKKSTGAAVGADGKPIDQMSPDGTTDDRDRSISSAATDSPADNSA